MEGKKQIVEAIETYLENAKKYRNSYFWRSTGTSSSWRRKQEFDFSFSFEFEGNKYYLEQELRISSRRFYWSTGVYKNGKKSNSKVLESILKKLR